LAISELEDVVIDQRLLDKGVTQCAICTGTRLCDLCVSMV
jgi:hypothetical protein